MALNMTNAGGVATAPQVSDPMTDVSTAGLDFAPTIAANLVGVDMLVKRPSGRFKMKQAEVNAKDENGIVEGVDLKKVTTPQFICDSREDHELWFHIDQNANLFLNTLICFSVSDARRGFHLVPMSKAANLVAKLSELRAQRRALVQDFVSQYDTWIRNLRTKFNGHFYLLESRLPSRQQLVDKFDVQWTLHPLTPIDPSHMKFTDINDADRERIISESNEMANELVKNRSRMIYDQVFGSVLTQCQEIASGAMETGKRKFGAISDLVNLLERLRNFHEFATPEIIQNATTTIGLLSNINSIAVINANEGQNQVTAAIKTAMRSVKESIQGILKSSERISSRRRLAI